MKKHSFNTLTDFYSDVKNHIGHFRYVQYENYDRPNFEGLSKSEIYQSKFSYDIGVHELEKLNKVKFVQPKWEKYRNTFDGYDIDLERMYEGQNFLINRRKRRNLPKTADIFVSLAEPAKVTYNELLMKSYTALRIIDQLESQGVRTAVYVFNAIETRGLRPNFELYVEVCVKDYTQHANIAALSTAISPWMLRRWMFLWVRGYYPVSTGLGSPLHIRKENFPKGSIVINQGECLSQYSANRFIENINISKHAE